MTVIRQRVSSRLLGLSSAVLLAPPTFCMAEESPTTTAALQAADVATGHGFNALLYLPVGFALAAIWLEIFAQWKKNREVEPAILFLLFGATGAAVAVLGFALGFSPVGRDNGQISAFAQWMGIAAVVLAVAFFLKRKARDRKLFALHVPPALSGRVNYPRGSGQKGLIIGYRIALGAALLLSVMAVSEMPLSQAQMPSVATALRGVMNPPKVAPAAVAEAPATPAAPAVTPAKVESSGGPKLADLLDKRTAEGGTAPKPTEPPAPATPAVSAPVTPAVAATTPPSEAPMGGDAAAPAPAVVPTAPPAAAEGTAMAPFPAPAPATPPAGTPPKTAATTPVAKLDKTFFATKVKPILDSKCTSCHGSQKAKGDLKLDTVDNIRKGAGHAVVVAGDLELSSLYQRLISTDDEDLMPPKDKGGPLPPAMIDAIKRWIQAGADYGDGTAATAATQTPARPGGRLEEEKAKTLGAPDAATVARLTSGGAVIRPLSSNGALLDINLSHYEGGPVNLQDLVPLAKNIHTLDCTKAKLNDAALAPLAQMTNLVRLQLNRNSSITDAGLVHLKGLTELESLNLYETQVTDAGLENLVGLKKLQKLFLFNTKCTPAGADKLKGQIPALVINLGS